MDDTPSLFSLPSDITKEIFSLVVGSTQEAIRIQATSKTFQNLVWKSMTYFSDVILFDRLRTKKIFERINKLAIKYLELVPLPPSPSNDNFELDLAEFSSLEYLSIESDLLIPTLNNPKLKDAFMKHKTLTSVKCITPPHAPLTNDLVHEISQSKKLYLIGTSNGHTSPTVTYMTNARKFTVKLEHVIGGFDGAATAGNAAKDFVLIGTDSGTVTVLKQEGERLIFKHSVKAHTGRINHVHTHPAFPKKVICVASDDGTVSLWDVGNNYEEPRVVLKCGEPIYQVCARINKTTGLVMAAGKRTAYLFNIDKRELIKTVPIDSDIIVLDDDSLDAKKGFAVCTHHAVHIFNDHGDETMTYKMNFVKPFCVTSEHTLHVVPHDGYAEVRLKSATKDAYYDKEVLTTFVGQYHSKPYTGAFADKQQVIVLSTDYGFDVLDFVSEQPVMSIGLPVTKKEIATRNFKQVMCLFIQEKYWHVIGSDGKLYSWRVYGKDHVESLSFSFVFAENFEKF